MSRSQPQPGAEVVRTAAGEALRQFRASRNLSQNQTAIRTGIDRGTINRWENGLVPQLEVVERFARGFGLDVNKWRQVNGYPPVEETDPVALANRLVELLAVAPEDARRVVEHILSGSREALLLLNDDPQQDTPESQDGLKAGA